MNSDTPRACGSADFYIYLLIYWAFGPPGTGGDPVLHRGTGSPIFQMLQFLADLLPSVCPLNFHQKIRLFRNPLLDARCFFFSDFR